jgi:hypothetical protein
LRHSVIPKLSKVLQLIFSKVINSDQLSPDSFEAKMSVNYKNFIFNQPKNFYNLQQILNAFYR